MAKTDPTKRRKRQSKVVKVIEEEDNVITEEQTETVSSSEETLGTEEDSPTGSTEVEMKRQQEEDHDEQGPSMNTVIEVKGNATTVTVSWEKNEEGEGDDEKKTNASDEKEMTEEHTQIISSADAVGSTEEAPSQTKMEQDMEECGDKQVNGKRKADPGVETSPSKKTKLINDGFSLFVGNLNNSKTFEEVKDSLANCFMAQSLLFQDIRLDRSRKHAFVDLASEMDLTKALMLNGEMVLDKPMKIAKAKAKSEDKVKVKAPPLDKKAKDARCLFLKNVPYNATKKTILKRFPKAIAVRFPGGTEGPSQGIAFLEFKNKTTAEKVLQRKQGAKIHGRDLIVDCVGETNMPKVTKANADKKNTKAAAPPNNTLFVSNLSYNVKEKNLKNVFQKAVSITIPQNKSKGRPKGFAFVEFATVAEAEKALQSSQNIKICKRAAKVQFCDLSAKPGEPKVLSKSLIVLGLAEKTTAETLKSAFEGAHDARVTIDKETGLSKRFGFVEFESEENCKAAKEAMGDCEIDGSKVIVAYAKVKRERGRQGARGGSAGRPSGKSAGPGAGRGGTCKGGRGSKGGRGRGTRISQDAVKEVKLKN